LVEFHLLSFVLPQKKVTKKRSRLYENFWFSTDWLCDATQAAPSHIPAHASVSLALFPGYEPSLENYRSFHNVGPSYIAFVRKKGDVFQLNYFRTFSYSGKES